MERDSFAAAARMEKEGARYGNRDLHDFDIAIKRFIAKYRQGIFLFAKLLGHS